MNSSPPTRLVEAFLLQRLLGGARNEQAHEPRIWSMWYGAWVAVNTHTSSPLRCKWGETQNIKGDPASRGLSSNFSTYILPSLQSYASKVVSGPSQGITLKCSFLFVMQQSSTNMEQSTGPFKEHSKRQWMAICSFTGHCSDDLADAAHSSTSRPRSKRATSTCSPPI